MGVYLSKGGLHLEWWTPPSTSNCIILDSAEPAAKLSTPSTSNCSPARPHEVPKLPADWALGSMRSPILWPTAPAQISLARNFLVWLTIQVPFNQIDMSIFTAKSQIAGLTRHPDQ
ncbi:hypothetical protein P7K49_019318 [Saguinus oedipus]|uniref:Uncharacterized protein n=1 Tax=Saguinus oedipus TaxID=9490 RepID=A0ABQ9UXA7_SAGOE|nr:hypothetical protein P7K49_019318 [Saguinus oedipus]